MWKSYGGSGRQQNRLPNKRIGCRSPPNRVQNTGALLRCPGNQADLTTLIRGVAGRFARDRAAALRGALGRFHRPQHFDGGRIIGRRFETLHAYRKFKRSFSLPRTVSPHQRIVKSTSLWWKFPCRVDSSCPASNQIASLRGTLTALRERRPRWIVSPVAEPLLSCESGCLEQGPRPRRWARWRAVVGAWIQGADTNRRKEVLTKRRDCRALAQTRNSDRLALRR